MSRLLQQSKPTSRNDPLAFALLSSCLLHTAVLALALMTTGRTGELRIQNYQRVTLLDIPQLEKKTAVTKRGVRPETKIAAGNKEKAEPTPPVKKEPRHSAREALPENVTHEEIPRRPEAFSPVLLQPPSLAAAKGEGGGPAGLEDSNGNSDIAVRSGAGTRGRGKATAESNFGKGSGASGSPAVFKTNREARPIQTARASYPPMALRMGIEGDVTLRIEVNSEGQVTRAEIVKSAGSGFDEEALKAVKQSRFEPAQNDGKNVPAEFTYVYRFRLTR